MPDLIPLRALNQVSYCPRLYYLQYVDCVMPTNEHVESGLHDHRRVDEPDLANRPRKEGDAVRTRGVHLSSEALGVAGVLDLVEEKGGESCPVETKHGGAPRDEAGRPTAWDNDAVSCAPRACSSRSRSARL
jgi:CRISPR-associated protein Cas1